MVVDENNRTAEVLDVLKSVAPEIDSHSIDSARAFRDQIELDSVDYLNFVLKLGKRFDVDIPERDYPQLSTLDGCVAYLGSRRATGG